jgi:hypothetical protein
MYVRVQNGYEMDEIHDVSAVSPANDDILKYNSTSGLWEKSNVLSTKQDTITLTTTGSGGSATLVGSTLNIPQYAGSGSGTSFIVGFNGTGVVPAGTINMTGLTGGGYVNTGNEFQRIYALPQTCSLSRWYVRTSATQPASGSLVITLRQNQVDTALAITIAAGSIGGTYSNTATSIAFSAGDLASVKVQNNGAANSTPIISLSIMVTI